MKKLFILFLFSSITFAQNYYEIRAEVFESKTSSCSLSHQRAYTQCLSWLKEEVDKDNVTGSCDECTCGANNGLCLGVVTAYFDSPIVVEAQKTLEYSTATSLKSCSDARHEALSAVYYKLKQFSIDEWLASFDLKACTCGHDGTQYEATCEVDLTSYEPKAAK